MGRHPRENYVKRMITLDKNIDHKLFIKSKYFGESKSSQIEKALREILG
jgi:hypothetical protein